jgi:Flp pilus assembly protein TadD
MNIAHRLCLVLATFAATSVWAAPKSASIVSLAGKGEVRSTGGADWASAATKQDLFSGDFVRTGDLSQMAILFVDNTQIRLNQNSQLQIKSLTDSASGPTAVKLNAGRAWGQIKPQTGGPTAGAPRVAMETPSATMSIRGTDWEVEVAANGKTQLVVLSGVVEMGNDHGQITVGRNEAAIAEIGKAPVKIVLTQPRERVQWVTAYRSEALRYLAAADDVQRNDPELKAAATELEAGQLAEARARLQKLPAGWVRDLMLADIKVSEGKLAEAIDLSTAAMKATPNAMPRAHLAGLFLMADRATEAKQLLAETLARDADATEALLAEGRRARFGGEAKAAEQAYAAAARQQPKDERGWQGLGIVANEREDAPLARRHLDQAAGLNPQDATTFAEIGTLESFANRFDAAEGAFARALSLRPDDYVALTGQGILKLKQGKTEEALEDFLKAGLIEPRYARARLYTGITYYQLGRISRAIEEFDKAAELDPKDPLPYLYSSMVHTDAFDAEKAVSSARAALERMPNLKSLNQVANNQKGAANVGNALSFWGLKDWAMSYAQDAEYPFWGGSHLFLADLYTGKFAKNSELFQGFLTDPTVFGASNRFQSLIHKPGNYQTLTMTMGQDHSIFEYVPRVTLNGYSNSAAPLAYFLEVDQQNGKVRPGTDFSYRDKTDSVTAALGWMPTNELRLFTYYNRDDTKSNFNNSTISKLDFKLTTSDLSLGGSYYFSPTFYAQARASRNRIEGNQDWHYPNTQFGTLVDDEISHDAQLGLRYRHEDSVELAGGYETARSPENSLLTVGFPGMALPIYSDGARLSERTELAYLSGKLFLSSQANAQLDLWWTDYEKKNQGEFFDGVTHKVDQRFNENRVTPRFGLTFVPWQNNRIRYAYQDWVRPSSAGGLGPVATAGIAVDDTFLRFGGRQKRNVLKLESEWSPKLFTEVSYDRQRVKNLGTYDISLAENFANLARVRQQSLTEVADFYAGNGSSELSNANMASSIRMDQVRLTANAIFTSTWSGVATYTHTDSRMEAGGIAPYYLPRNNLRFGTTWISPARIRLSFDALWTSKAWTFQDMTSERAGYWNGAVSAYWESTDKKAAVALFAKELLSPYASAFYGIAANLRF